MPIVSFEQFLTESFDFFPESQQEIERTLNHFPQKNALEIAAIYQYLKDKFPNIKTPLVAIDKKKNSSIKITRRLEGLLDLRSLKKELDIKVLAVSFGNGSSGNRGANNRGNAFENDFAEALLNWNTGLEDEIKDKSLLNAINDLDRTYNISKSGTFTIEVVGGENTPRPIEYSSNRMLISNPKGSGLDVGASVTDITVTTDSGPIFLSLKFGRMVTFFNVGIATTLRKEEIDRGEILDPRGLTILNTFGLDNSKFCNVFTNRESGSIENNPKFNKRALIDFIQSGVGFGYHMIHKIGSTTHSKKIDQAYLRKASNINELEIFYGGKSGSAKRIDIVAESPIYKFNINIRNKQGGIHPSHIMCDYIYKE